MNGDMMSGHWLRHMSPGHRARSGSCRMAACSCAKILDLHIYLYRGLKIRSITQFALSPSILYYSLSMLYVYVLMGRDGLMHNKVTIYLYSWPPIGEKINQLEPSIMLNKRYIKSIKRCIFCFDFLSSIRVSISLLLYIGKKR